MYKKCKEYLNSFLKKLLFNNNNNYINVIII